MKNELTQEITRSVKKKVYLNKQKHDICIDNITRFVKIHTKYTSAL